MGRKTGSGLIRRGEVWYVDKHIGKRRIRKSTGTGDRHEAEMILARWVEEDRLAAIFGVRPKRSFEEAAARFILEHRHKRSLGDDIQRLQNLMPWIGSEPLDRIHMGTLQSWIDHRLEQGRAAATINQGLQIVRRILNLAARRWRDENGLTWLMTVPEIAFLPDRQKRQPYPLSWDEQERLFAELPQHLLAMAKFAVNTGCRDSEICKLQWAWEVTVAPLSTSVFIIPAEIVKNGLDRLVVLNCEAAAILARQRGQHATHVFHHKGRPITRMLNSAWLRARLAAGLPEVRVHDLKHTFGRRLRAAGVGFEDRQDLLGHVSQRVTTHYSAAELGQLIEAANTVCGRGEDRPELVVLKRGRSMKRHKSDTDTRIFASYVPVSH